MIKPKKAPRGGRGSHEPERRERYLENLRLYHQGGKGWTMKRCAEHAGVAFVTVTSSWRKRYSDFRSRELQAIEESKERQGSPLPGPIPTPDLPPTAAEVEQFFAALVETDDRLEACRRTNLRWKDVKAQIHSEPEWKARYAEFLEERKVKAEDVIWRDVLSGTTSAAQKWLQAHDPVWTSKTKVDVTNTVRFDAAQVEEERQNWLATFSQKALPPADVVDAEYVEEPN